MPEIRVDAMETGRRAYRVPATPTRFSRGAAPNRFQPGTDTRKRKPASIRRPASISGSLCCFLVWIATRYRNRSTSPAPRVDFMTRIFCSLRIWQPQSRSHQQMPPGKRNMTLEAPPVWITALVLVLFVLFPIGISLLGLKQIFKVHRFRKGAVRVIGTVVDIKETTRCLQPPNTISSAAANTQSW